jgi:small conductance mechanosensitive channel
MDLPQDLLHTFHLYVNNVVRYIPALLGGILCFVISLFTGNFFSNIVIKYTTRRTHDTLIANFIGKVVWSVIFVVGCVLSLGIVGLGTISNKILAGAGLTTFIVGFALKDIGENFLSGLILAFSRPYKVGSLIECDGVKGIVRNMTMRQTTVEADNEKVIMIPNSAIIKNPLIRYSVNDRNARQEFYLQVEAARAREAVGLIQDTVSAFEEVLKESGYPVKVIIDELSGDKVKLLVIFWYNMRTFKGSRSGSRSEIMLTVFDRLREGGYSFSG